MLGTDDENFKGVLFLADLMDPAAIQNNDSKIESIHNTVEKVLAEHSIRCQIGTPYGRGAAAGVNVIELLKYAIENWEGIAAFLGTLGYAAKKAHMSFQQFLNHRVLKPYRPETRLYLSTNSGQNASEDEASKSYYTLITILPDIYGTLRDEYPRIRLSVMLATGDNTPKLPTVLVDMKSWNDRLSARLIKYIQRGREHHDLLSWLSVYRQFGLILRFKLR